MPYRILKTAVYDGTPCKAGDVIDELREGVARAALRTGMIVDADDYEEPAPAADDEAAVEPTDYETTNTEAAPVEAAAGEPIAALELDDRIVKALKAAKLTTVDAALDYLDEYGTFAGVKGIGSASSDKIIAALS